MKKKTFGLQEGESLNRVHSTSVMHVEQNVTYVVFIAHVRHSRHITYQIMKARMVNYLQANVKMDIILVCYGKSFVG